MTLAITGATVERHCKMTNFVAGGLGRFYQSNLQSRNNDELRGRKPRPFFATHLLQYASTTPTRDLPGEAEGAALRDLHH